MNLDLSTLIHNLKNLENKFNESSTFSDRYAYLSAVLAELNPGEILVKNLEEYRKLMIREINEEE